MHASKPTVVEPGRRATFETTVINDPRDAEPIREEWDELAVAAGRPYCSPAWMLAWWAHARTGDARLRTIVLSEHGHVLAVAPFFAQIGKLGLTEYRLLGAGHSHRIGLLCRGGYEPAVAAPLGRALRGLDPHPSSIVWEGLDASDEWPARTARTLAGPAGVKLRRDARMAAPTVQLAGLSFQGWLEGRSSKFRRDLGRDHRNLEKSGGRIRRTRNADELDADLATFARLHAARWAPRGGSGFFDEAIAGMLRDAASELLATDRFRLYVVELAGAPIAATVCVAAGGRVAAWGSGMDDVHARLSPTRLALLKAVEEAFECGDRWFDFGGGANPYKVRFANSDEPVVWMTQFPRGLRYPLTRAQLMPKQGRHALRELARRMPTERQQQLKRMLRRT